MRKEFRTKLNGDESKADASACFRLPFDTRYVWCRAKETVKVTINGYTWRSTVGNRGDSLRQLHPGKLRSSHVQTGLFAEHSTMIWRTTANVC